MPLDLFHKHTLTKEQAKELSEALDILIQSGALDKRDELAARSLKNKLSGHRGMEYDTFHLSEDEEYLLWPLMEELWQRP